MKYHQFTRIFSAGNLSNKIIILSNLADIHYLVKVMRKRVADQILLFNNKDGEFIVKIIEIKPKQITFEAIEQIRQPEPQEEINLIFAPIKQNRMMFLLEKATELGVTILTPIQTSHSVVDKVNIDKWQIYIKEATEQCRRLSLPQIKPLASLNSFLNTWPEDQLIYLCNETEKSTNFGQIKKSLPINIMIGPEGGFSVQELEILTAKKFITSVHLGRNILRSETAAITAIALSL
jgi:16S rRNA (uracil1498-N3)-methyltransferase